MKLWIFVLSFLLFSFSEIHKYFHSYTDFQINTKTGNAEAVIELFWHDLELSLSKQYHQSISVKDDDFSSLLQQYLSSHFQLKGKDQKVISFSFVGYEIKRDEIEIYLEYKQLNDFSGFYLMNSLLLDEFPEQVNQVMVKHKGKKSTYVLNSKKREVQL